MVLDVASGGSGLRCSSSVPFSLLDSWPVGYRMPIRSARDPTTSPPVSSTTSQRPELVGAGR